MTFHDLLNAVFCANELAYFNGLQPLSDEVLSQVILRESSEHKIAQESAIRLVLPVKHPQRKKLSRYRGCYNLFRHGKESPARCISFRYNEEGKRIGNQSHREVALLQRDKEEDTFYRLLQRNFPGKKPTDAFRLIYVEPAQADRVLSRLQSLFSGVS